MTLTLDDIRAAVGKKYASTDIDFGGSAQLVLRNPLRLGKDDRKALMGLQDDFNIETDDESDDDDDELEGPREAMKKAILIAAVDKAVAKEFLKIAAEVEGDELPILTEVFSAYMGEGQAGEA